MDALAFEKTAIPATATKTAVPNPFDGQFPADTEALSVLLPANTEAEEKAVKTLMGQARKAAIAVERTARIKVEKVEVGTGKAKTISARLTVWTVPQIKRPRKNGDAPATA